MYVHVCVYVCAYVCAYVHVYIYVYAYLCVCVYVYIYMYMHTHVVVHMHSCRRICFICTVQSLSYMRVYHMYFLNNCMRVWWGIGSRFFFQLVHD